MDNDVSSDKLKSKIANAFPSPFNLSHEACIEVRIQLFSAQGQDVLNLLGPILIDLVSHHSRASGDPATADCVVRFLASASPPALEILPSNKLDTSQILDFIAVQERESKALFDRFNFQQACAIKDRLITALSWQEQHLPQDEIEAALDYWSKPR